MPKILWNVFIVSWVFVAKSKAEWKKFDGYEYYVNYNAVTGYSQAVEGCKALGGTLANVKTTAIQNFLVGIIVEPTEFPRSFYIGLRRNDSISTNRFDRFQWDDGTLISATDSQWNSATNQPSGGANETCVVMGKQFTFMSQLLWNDISCSFEARSVCQRVAATTTTTTTTTTSTTTSTTPTTTTTTTSTTPTTTTTTTSTTTPKPTEVTKTQTTAKTSKAASTGQSLKPVITSQKGETTATSVIAFVDRNMTHAGSPPITSSLLITRTLAEGENNKMLFIALGAGGGGLLLLVIIVVVILALKCRKKPKGSLLELEDRAPANQVPLTDEQPGEVGAEQENHAAVEDESKADGKQQDTYATVQNKVPKQSLYNRIQSVDNAVDNTYDVTSHSAAKPLSFDANPEYSSIIKNGADDGQYGRLNNAQDPPSDSSYNVLDLSNKIFVEEPYQMIDKRTGGSHPPGSIQSYEDVEEIERQTRDGSPTVAPTYDVVNRRSITREATIQPTANEASYGTLTNEPVDDGQLYNTLQK